MRRRLLHVVPPGIEKWITPEYLRWLAAAHAEA
jgi:hypothetical protein